MRQLRNFVFYYGAGQVNTLGGYDLVVLQPEAPERAEGMRQLKAQGVSLLAYLSVGETAHPLPDAAWYIPEPESGEPARNPRWGSVYVDCRSEAWHRHILEQAIPTLVKRGFEGLFLDTLDVQDRYPTTRGGVIRLLESIRARYPALLLAANRGFSILESVSAVADLFVFEALTSYYDGERYRAWEGSDLLWTEHQARRLQAIRGSRAVLALDYAAREEAVLRQLAESRARKHGFLSFVGPALLDELPEL